MKTDKIIASIIFVMGTILLWIGLYIVDLFENIYTRTTFLIIPTIAVVMVFVSGLHLIGCDE